MATALLLLFPPFPLFPLIYHGGSFIFLLLLLLLLRLLRLRLRLLLLLLLQL